MARYRAFQERIDGFEVWALEDTETGSVARVLPEIGNNLWSFSIQGFEVLAGPADLQELRQPSNEYRYGIPILSPPNRIVGGGFSFAGRRYQFPLNEEGRNHIHGELASRPWKVADASWDERGGARLTSVFRTVDHPDIFQYFPHELEYTANYALKDGVLSLGYTVVHGGETVAPFAFGLHPYYRLNPVGGPWTLRTAVAGEFPVNDEALVIGEEAYTEVCRQLNRGMAVSEIGPGAQRLLRVTDPVAVIELAGGGRMTRVVHEGFSFLLVFRPPWMDGISVEPYTCLPNAFNLERPWEDTGARAMEPGERLTFAMTITHGEVDQE